MSKNFGESTTASATYARFSEKNLEEVTQGSIVVFGLLLSNKKLFRLFGNNFSTRKMDFSTVKKCFSQENFESNIFLKENTFQD